MAKEATAGLGADYQFFTYVTESENEAREWKGGDFYVRFVDKGIYQPVKGVSSAFEAAAKYARRDAYVVFYDAKFKVNNADFATESEAKAYYKSLSFLTPACIAQF